MRHRRGSADWLPGHAATEEAGVHLYLKQPLVLAHNIKAMESIEKIIPSFVRFEIFDDASFSVGKPLYEFTPFVSSGHKDGFIVHDRKIDVVPVGYAEPRTDGAGKERPGGLSAEDHYSGPR